MRVPSGGSARRRSERVCVRSIQGGGYAAVKGFNGGWVGRVQQSCGLGRHLEGEEKIRIVCMGGDIFLVLFDVDGFESLDAFGNE